MTDSMKQPLLFDIGHPDAPPLFTCERDRILANVEAQAGDEFRDSAVSFVLSYLGKHGPTPGEAITNACKAAGIVPADDRAFGPVYMRLARRGLIRRCGTCTRTKGHGTQGGSIWELVRE